MFLSAMRLRVQCVYLSLCMSQKDIFYVCTDSYAFNSSVVMVMIGTLISVPTVCLQVVGQVFENEKLHSRYNEADKHFLLCSHCKQMAENHCGVRRRCKVKPK